MAITMLKWAVGITFIAHGVKAWLYDPLFIDYLMAGLDGIFGITINEVTAGQLLRLIGVVDIFFGALALFKFPYWIYFYMAFWGGLTACYRIYFHGDFGILPMFVRINHLLIPLYLGLYFKQPRVEAINV